MTNETAEVFQIIGLIWGVILLFFLLYHVVHSYSIHKMMKSKPVAPITLAWIPLLNNICVIRLVEERLEPRFRKWLPYLITVPFIVFIIVAYLFFSTHITQPFRFFTLDDMQGGFIRHVIFMVVSFVLMVLSLLLGGLGLTALLKVEYELFEEYLGNGMFWIVLILATGNLAATVGYYLVARELERDNFEAW